MVGSVDGVAIFVGYKRDVDVDVVDVSRVVRGQVRTITPAPTVRHDALLARQLRPHLTHCPLADDCRTRGKTTGTKTEVLPAPKEIDKSISETR